MSAERRSIFSVVLIFLLGFFVLSAFPDRANANIINYKDTLSTSVAGAVSNHTIQFQTNAAIDPGETITFRPDPGNFSVPAILFSTSTGSTSPPTPNTFSNNNIEFFVDTGSGYVRRDTATTSATTTDGVTIVSGTSGSVSIVLSDTIGVPANAYMRLLIGNHTSLSTSTDTSITNAAATTSYPFYLSKTGTDAVEVRGWIAMTDGIGVGPVDTTETVPPFRFNGAPTSTVSAVTPNVEVTLETDEFAICRYEFTPGVAYGAMTNTFTNTGLLLHSFILGVIPETDYNIYVRCIDDEFNANTDDYVISFSVSAQPAGSAGDPDDDPGAGDDDGSGSGSSGSGSGSSSGGGGGSSNSSGSSGSGGGGGTGDDTGSDAGGGLEADDDAYPSGDGRVIINGYAFPNSDVVALVDGSIAEIERANSEGKYAITIDAIARGVYNFGVYAVDRNNVKSSTFTTTFSVTGSRVSSLSNINVMPSILVEPDPVDPGQTLTISGYTIPDAAVTIENESDVTTASRKSFNATSDGSGFWTIEVDTSGFRTGTYKVRARAQTDEVSTNFSDYTYYGVGEEADAPLNADLNRDGSVNLIDFSILLFWWGTDGGDSDPPADINRDGTTSLTDFSILLFNWTG